MIPAIEAYNKIIDDITNHPPELICLGEFLANITDEISDIYETELTERESKLHQIVGTGIRTSHILTFKDRTLMVGYDLMDGQTTNIYIVVAMVRDFGDKMVRTRKALFLYDEEMQWIFQIENPDPEKNIDSST